MEEYIKYGKYGKTDMRCHRNLKEMVANNDVPLGLYVSFPTPFIAEMSALAGFDYLMLDMEHHIFNPETISNMVRAADACGIATAVRIAQLDLIPPLLDFGIVGFKIPHVHSAKQVKELVRQTKYAPVGRRGFCAGGRSQRFGTMPFALYEKEAAEEIFLMVMIEDQEGIDNMEEILAVPGIDYVAVGPGDISQALGHLSETEHPEVLAVIEKIYKTADKYGVKYPGNGAPVIVTDDKTVLLEALTEKAAAVRRKEK